MLGHVFDERPGGALPTPPRGRMGPLYTTHDVSRITQMDPSTISKWIDKGPFPVAAAQAVDAEA